MTEFINEDALRSVLATAKGRKVIWDILAFTGLYRQPWVQGSPDATAFNSGMQNVGQALWADCQACHAKFTSTMIMEQQKNEHRSEPATAGTDDSGSAGPGFSHSPGDRPAAAAVPSRYGTFGD